MYMRQMAEAQAEMGNYALGLADGCQDKPDDLGDITGTHMLERENRFLHIAL